MTIHIKKGMRVQNLVSLYLQYRSENLMTAFCPVKCSLESKAFQPLLYKMQSFI